MARRFFWMKLETSFFNDKVIKKMRRCENGDTLTVIYLKLLLSTLATEGRITYEHLEDSLSSELALQLDEDENEVEELLKMLLKYQLLIEIAKDEYQLTAVSSMVGSEGSSAARMRAKRQRDSVSQGDGRASQSDSNCDAEKNERRLIEKKITANATAAIGGGREEENRVEKNTL